MHGAGTHSSLFLVRFAVVAASHVFLLEISLVSAPSAQPVLEGAFPISQHF